METGGASVYLGLAKSRSGMNARRPTKNLTGTCGQCGGPLTFPAEMVGTIANCPRCGKATELQLAIPASEPTIPRRTIVWTAVVVIILLGGTAGALIALKRAERMAAERKTALAGEAPATTNPAQSGAAGAPAVLLNGFALGPVTLQTGPDGSVRVVGTARNTTGRTQKQVGVRLDLFDVGGRPAGVALDSTSAVAPGAEWRFGARVLVTKAASARVVSIGEEPQP